MQSTLREYDTRLDIKKRLTVRGARFDYYHVTEYDDGRIVLEPRVLIAPEGGPPSETYVRKS